MSRILLFLAGFAYIAIGASFQWTDFNAGGIFIAGFKVDFAYYTSLIIAATGSLAFAKYVIEAISSSCSFDRRLFLLFIFVFVLNGASTWYGFFLTGEFLAYEYRSTAQALAFFIGAMCVAAASDVEKIGFIDVFFSTAAAFPGRFLVAMCSLVLLAGGTIAFFVLDAMPHMSDGLTYLMQGRVYWSGHLAIESPANPNLLNESGGFFFHEGPKGFFGKYPPAWPLLLGLFDLFKMSWLAAPITACGTLLVTYFLVDRELGRKYACLSTLLLAASPWLWFNAATQMSHLLSAFLLWGFMDRFMAMMKSHSYRNACFSGVFLGFAVITRPQDALFFAVPAIGYSAWSFLSWNSRVAYPSILVALSAIPGVACYLAFNQYYMGGVGVSPYGNSILQTLFYNPPTSITHWLSWFHENSVMLNQQVFGSAVPTAAFISVSLVCGWKKLRVLRLPILSVTSLIFCYSFVIFINRPWVGPRWHVPALPMVAIVLAVGLISLSERCETNCNMKASQIPRFLLRYFVVAFAVSWLVATPTRLTDLWMQPPHNVDGRTIQAVKRIGLTNAILGMELVTDGWNWKDPRAGMAGMAIPLSSNDVIFVEVQENWMRDSAATWPERDIYLISPKSDDYTITKIQD